MTREESKKMIYDASKQDTGSPKDCIHLLSLHRFIEQIFDDHEAQLKALQQRSCEGCKHYKFTYNSNDGAVRQLMTICSDCFRRLNRDNYEPKEQ